MKNIIQLRFQNNVLLSVCVSGGHVHRTECGTWLEFEYEKWTEQK